MQGSQALIKGTLTCSWWETGFKPVILQLPDDSLYLLSYSHPKHYTCWTKANVACLLLLEWKSVASSVFVFHLEKQHDHEEFDAPCKTDPSSVYISSIVYSCWNVLLSLRDIFFLSLWASNEIFTRPLPLLIIAFSHPQGEEMKRYFMQLLTPQIKTLHSNTVGIGASQGRQQCHDKVF